jgi:hypothetical protein
VKQENKRDYLSSSIASTECERRVRDIGRSALSAKSRHRASLFDHLVGPLRSWRHKESQVESSEHQDYANIHYQPLPESISEEHEIYTDYNGCHRHHVKHYSYPSVHFGTTLFHFAQRAA